MPKQTIIHLPDGGIKIRYPDGAVDIIRPAKRAKLPWWEIRLLWDTVEELIRLMDLRPATSETPADMARYVTNGRIKTLVEQIKKMPRRLRGNPKLYPLAVKIRDNIVEVYEIWRREVEKASSKGDMEEVMDSIHGWAFSMLKTVLYYIRYQYGEEIL